MRQHQKRASTGFARIVTLACAVVLAACGTAAAQGLQPGVRGGMNLSSLATEGTSGDVPFRWRSGFVGGGFLVWPIASWLDVQPEVLYTSRGATVEQFGITSRMLLEYLEVPVLARYTMPAFGNSRFFVAGGPSLALRLRARTRASFSGATEEIDISDDVKRRDVGVVAAAGLETASFVVDGRYTFGFTNLDNDTGTAVKFTNRTVSLSLGFKF
jgi:hypothetical protein